MRISELKLCFYCQLDTVKIYLKNRCREFDEQLRTLQLLAALQLIIMYIY